MEKTEGNAKTYQQGFVTRTYNRTYEVEDNEGTENTDDNDSSEEDTTDRTNYLSDKHIFQSINVNRANVVFKISGTAKADSVPLTSDNRTFGIALKIHYSDGTTEDHYQEYNAYTSAEQSISLSVTPEKANKSINTVDFAFVYGYNKNTMEVKNAMLNFAEAVIFETPDESTGNNEPIPVDEDIVSESVDTSKDYIETSVEYDSTKNYITKEVDEAGNTTEYAYDSNGNQTSVTDGNGNTTEYEYDIQGNVKSISSGDSSNTYIYNNKNQLSAINHNDFAYNFNYNIYNNLLEVKVGNQRIVAYNYNSNNGNLESISYGNGGFFRYFYDRYDRITLVTGAGYNVVSYTYNKKGLVTKEHDYWLNQTINYYYDCNGNLVSKTAETVDEYGIVKLVHSVSLDSDGNTVEQTNINNRYKTIKRGTDADDNEFVDYISGDENSPRTVKVTSETDDFGRLDYVSTKHNDNELFGAEYAYITNSHKTTNQVRSLRYGYNNGAKSINYDYTYDANGNIATAVERNYDIGTGGVGSLSSRYQSSYEYDSLNQVTQVTDSYSNEKTKISYDNAGNITKVQVYNLTTNALKKTNNYGYDTTWKDKLTSYNGQTITYDAIGNPLQYRDGMTMQWKNGRQLSQITTSKDTVTYKYNVNGLRTRKDNSDYTNYYYYDDNNNLIAMMQGSVVAYYYYDSNNSVTAMSLNDTMYYYIKNLQGDITKIVNESGNVLVEYTYDAWGKILNETSSESGAYARIKDFNPFRYRGYVYDSDTGLYYLQSRYYDPQTGRFINADDTVYIGATGTALSGNIFAYCENNIINFVDFNGRHAVLLINKNGAYGMGHAAILIKHKKKWYYFSVSDKKSDKKMYIDFVCIGKNIRFHDVKYINTAINNKKIKYKAEYTEFHFITGNFNKSYKYAKKIYKHPEKYNLLTNNCLKVAARILNKGKCSSKYYATAVKLLNTMVIPNNASFAFYYFKRHYLEYYNASYFERLFMKDPYYYFYN